MVYEDFTLSFVQGGELLVRAESWASGKATTFTDAKRLGQLGQEIEVTLNQRFWHELGEASASERLRKLGGELFSLVFSGKVAEVFHLELGRLSTSNARGLRLRLEFEPEDPELAWLEDLAWEILFCPRLDGFLALDRRFSLVRSLPVPLPIPPAARCPRLLCLGVISAPRGATDIDPKAELGEIKSALRDVGQIGFESLPEGVAHALRQRLLEGGFQVLHFMGHGFRKEEHGATVFGLVLEDEYGDQVRLDSREWASLIGDTDLRLVVLNACRSAERAARKATEPFHGVAQRLVRAGLPAVVAMRQEISELGARVFSPELYRRLGAGDPIDAAMTEARKAMERSGAPLGEWAVPAMYLRTTAEILFQIEPETSRTPIGHSPSPDPIEDRELLPPPPLPPHFLDLTERLEPLERLLLDPRAHRLAAVHGMSGIGKTVLAAAVSAASNIYAGFPEGVLWLPVGRAPQISDLLDRLARSQGGSGVSGLAPQIASEKVRSLLRGKRVLLVLDDVWETRDAALLAVCDLPAKNLITTQIAAVVAGLGIPSRADFNLAVLHEDQALALLAATTGELVEELPPDASEVVSRCGHHPLAISMVGSMIRLQPKSWAWENALELLRAADLEKIRNMSPDYPHPSIPSAIQSSIEALGERERQRYFQLAVFESGTAIPLAALQVLWNASRSDTRDLATTFTSRSLATWASSGAAIRLHNLLEAFLRSSLGDTSGLHGKLVEGYRALCPKGWHSGADDGYFFDRLPYHLHKAGRLAELSDLLFDFHWLQKKLFYSSIASLVRDLNLVTSDDEVALLGRAIRLSAHSLGLDSRLLAGQLLGRLTAAGGERIRKLLAMAATESNGPCFQPISRCLTQPDESALLGQEARRGGRSRPAMIGDTRVAIGSIDGIIRVFDFDTGKVALELSGHSDGVEAIVFVEELQQLASGSADATVRLWDGNSGELLSVLTGHTGAIWVLELIERALLASGSIDGTVRIWDARTRNLVQTVEVEKAVTALCDLGDGMLGVALEDATVEVWSWRSRRRTNVLQSYHGEVHSITTIDYRRIATTGADGTVQIWEIDKVEPQAILYGHRGPVTSSVLLDQGRLASGGHDLTVRVWNLETASEILSISLDESAVMSLCRVGGDSLLICGVDSAEIWTTEPPQQRCFVRTRPGWIWDLSLTDDRCVALAMSEPEIYIVSTEDLTKKNVLTGHEGQVYALACPRSGYLLSASEDSTIRLWDVVERRAVRIFRGHEDVILSLAMIDDHRFVSCGADATWRLWNIDRDEAIAAVDSQCGSIISITPLGNRRLLTCSADDSSMRIWEVSTGELLKTIPDAGTIADVVVLDESRIITAYLAEGSLRMWNLDTGQQIGEFIGHTDWIYRLLRVSSHGLLSISHDCSLRLWDLRACQLLTWYHFDVELTALARHRDGRIFVGDADGHVHALRLQGFEELGYAADAFA